MVRWLTKPTCLFAVCIWAPALQGMQSDVAFPAEVYAGRRARLMDRLEGAPVIVSGRYLIRNSGRDKQDPNFWYLTGVESPYAILVMAPGPAAMRKILFLPERFQFAGAQYPFPDDRMRRAAWNRPIRRLSPGVEAQRATGISETYPIDEFAERLPQIVAGSETVWIVAEGGALYHPPGLGGPPITVGEHFGRTVTNLLAPARVNDATPVVERMRLVKDVFEIAALRRAAEISAIGLRELMGEIRPGMNDQEAAGVLEYAWQREGSPRTSFGRIITSGPAAVSLYTLKSENYNSTDRVMQDGELLYVDYGAAEWRGYTSDISRVYPVSGRFSPEQRRLYEIVLEAQEAALSAIEPGVLMVDVIRAAAAVFRDHDLEQYEDIDRMGVDRVWGVMPSPTYWLAQGGTLTDYSGARGTGVRDLGHHIGLEALDSRDYSTPLEPGMVFTVEPKLYVPEMGIAIMIEDMVVVTADGYDNLSKDAPKTVEEIERILAERN